MTLLRHKLDCGGHCSQGSPDTHFSQTQSTQAETGHCSLPALPSLASLQPCWPTCCAVSTPGKPWPQNVGTCCCFFLECVSWDSLTSVSLSSFRSPVQRCIISKVLNVKSPALCKIAATLLLLLCLAFPVLCPCFVFPITFRIWYIARRKWKRICKQRTRINES